MTEKLKKYCSLIMALILIVATVILRCLQMLNEMDMETGFFYKTSSPLSWIPYVILLCGGVVLCALLIFQRKAKLTMFKKKTTAFTEKQVWWLGILFLISGSCMFGRIISLFNGAFEPISFVGLVLVFCIYLVIGFSFIGKRSIGVEIGFVAIPISIYFVVKASMLFKDNLVIINLSEKLLILLGYVASALFFLGLARVFSRNETRFTRLKMFISGLVAFVLTISVYLADVIVLFTGPADISALVDMPSLELVGTGTLIFFNMLIFSGEKSEKTVKAE